MEARAARRPGGFPRPVLLGVLPLHTARHAEFLHNEVPGITIPDEVRAAMQAAGERGGGGRARDGRRAPRADRQRSCRAPTSCPASAATSSAPGSSAASARAWERRSRPELRSLLGGAICGTVPRWRRPRCISQPSSRRRCARSPGRPGARRRTSSAKRSRRMSPATNDHVRSPSASLQTGRSTRPMRSGGSMNRWAADSRATRAQVIVLDTSAILRPPRRSRRAHRGVVDALDADPGPYLVPAAILAEIGYLIENRLGARPLRTFLEESPRAGRSPSTAATATSHVSGRSSTATPTSAGLRRRGGHRVRGATSGSRDDARPT